MKTFLGIGLGPIQTSIFLDGAFRGGFGLMGAVGAGSEN